MGVEGWDGAEEIRENNGRRRLMFKWIESGAAESTGRQSPTSRRSHGHRLAPSAVSDSRRLPAVAAAAAAVVLIAAAATGDSPGHRGISDSPCAFISVARTAQDAAAATEPLTSDEHAVTRNRVGRFKAIITHGEAIAGWRCAGDTRMSRA